MKGRKKRWRRRRLSPFQIRVVSWLAWFCILLLCRSLRFKVVGEEEALPKGKGGVILVWHGQQLIGFYFFRRRRYGILNSLSRDGDFSAAILKRFGWKIVRGSSSRGGVRGLIELIRLLRRGVIVGLTPDGPSGPLHQVKPGAVYLGQKTGAPLIPVAFVPEKYWEVNSWDRFIIPKPFTRCVAHFGPPVTVPSDITPDSFESWREKIADAIQESNRRGREELGRWA